MIYVEEKLLDRMTLYDAASHLAGVAKGEALVPMLEENVLPCGLANAECEETEYLDYHTALRCVDRVKQRYALAELSPPWFWGEGYVVKARASTMGAGVMVVEDTRGLDTYYAQWAELEGLVVERFMPGPQYELGGWTEPDGYTTWGVPMKQLWSNGKVLTYEAVTDERIIDDLRTTTRQAIVRLGLRGPSYFCCEMRAEKVIDFHCRPGCDDNATYQGRDHVRDFD